MKKDRDKHIMQQCRSDTLPPSPEEKEKILKNALERMVMINGNVYGMEDDAEPEAFADCAAKTISCRARCCAYMFALTQEEVRKGLYPYDAGKPYYMARDADGYCPYLDRSTFQCAIHEKRPLRCRKYVCPESCKRP